MFVFLQHQYRRALTQYKAAAVQVERGRSLCRIAFSSQCLHGAEAAQCEFGNGGFAAAAEANVQIAVLDLAERFANGVGRRCTGSGGAEVVAAEAGADRYLSGSHVADHHGHEERRDPSRSLCTILIVFFFDSADAADAAADNGAYTIRIHILEVRACVLQRLNRRCHGDLGKAFHVANVLAFKIFCGVEIADNAGNADTQFGGVKAVDLGNTQCSLFYVFPELFYGAAQRVYRTQSGDYYSFHISSLSAAVLRQACFSSQSILRLPSLKEKANLRSWWKSPLHHQSAGDLDGLTGDIARIFRAEERDHARHFFRIAVPLHCHQFQHLVPLFLGESVSHGRLDEARSNGVDGDISGTQFLCHGLGHADNGSLGSGIVDLSRIAVQTGY